MSAQHLNNRLLELCHYPAASRVELREGERQIAVVNTPEDARRLRACWNACQGMRIESIEELAAIGHGVPRLIVLCDDRTKERDDLAGALTVMATRNAQADVAKLKGGVS